MHPRRKGILLIAGAALLWSSGGIGIKAIADSALKVTFYRSLFAAIALLLFLRRAQWRRTASFVVAVICYAACLTTFVIATKWTTAANAIFLQYAGVVWVLLLSPIMLHEPMRGREAIAIAVALVVMAEHVQIRALEHVRGSEDGPQLAVAVETRDRAGPAFKAGVYSEDVVWIQLRGGLLVGKARECVED